MTLYAYNITQIAQISCNVMCVPAAYISLADSKVSMMIVIILLWYHVWS